MKLTLALLALLSGLAALPAQADEAPLTLSFGDFFARPIGPLGLQPTPQLLAAQGKPVRLVGYMVQREQPQAGQFLFTPRPVTMAEHADGEADDLPATTVTVLLPEGQRDRLVAFRPGALVLQGRLDYGPAEVEPGRVSWLRLQLTANALESAASPAVSHSH
jgi:hypothetical protein